MADLLPEKWMKGIAITTTILAVVAAIASSRSSFFVAKAQLLTALEGSQWSYYQAKSIKQDLLETKVRFLQASLIAAPPEQKSLLNQTIEDFSKDIVRYGQEKVAIKKKAESINRGNALGVRRGGQFSLAVVFAQIGIMLSAVGVLLVRRELWFVGLVMGAIALFYIANGFLLFY